MNIMSMNYMNMMNIVNVVNAVNIMDMMNAVNMMNMNSINELLCAGGGVAVLQEAAVAQHFSALRSSQHPHVSMAATALCQRTQHH
jgi:hypothetical protein